MKTKKDCLDYLTWTYYFRRIIKNPAYYGVENSTPESNFVSQYFTIFLIEINEFVIDLINSSLKALEEHRCIKIGEDEFSIESTFLGHIASFYYVRHTTVAHFEANLKEDLTIINLIKLISDAREFEEIPLRHNEDNYNEALAKICPYSLPNKQYDSSNFKTFLLFQMYFGRLPPPIRDYVTDAKLAIDGAMRIVMAIIDIAADKGYLQVVFNLCYIMQMIVQGLWIHDSQFKNIPHFTDTMIKILNNEEKITYLPQLQDVIKKGEFANIMKKHKIDLSVREIVCFKFNLIGR